MSTRITHAPAPKRHAAAARSPRACRARTPRRPASHELGAPLEGNPHVCESCLQHPSTTCPRCNGQRSAVLRYRAAGVTDAEIAARLRITLERLAAFDELAADKAETDSFKSRTVELEKLQAIVRRSRRDPAFSFAALARAAGVGQAGGIERTLGLRKKSGPSRASQRAASDVGHEATADAAVDLATDDMVLEAFEHEDGDQVATTIDVDIAGRIARALGALPSDVDTI